MKHPKYPLKMHEFAWMRHNDSQRDYRDHIAHNAVEEDWGPNKTYLYDYLCANFQISRLQDKVKIGPGGKYALWRAGNLTTRSGQPITILALKNQRPNKQPFVYTATFEVPKFTVRDRDGNEHLEKAPEAPEYNPPEYRAGYELTYNFEHYLQDHERRVSKKLKKLNSHQRFLCIYAAAEIAHKRCSDALSAVPQWYCDKNEKVGNYQWLLPLRINDEDISRNPDFVAAVDPRDEHDEYYIRTVMPPRYVYGQARAVAGAPRFEPWHSAA